MEAPTQTRKNPFDGKTWFEAKLYARPQGVDRERGAILGCSVVTAGPALGHGVELDDEFVAKVVELGNSERGGLKARFGHPNMCSTALGTFLGRWRSFSVKNGKAVADLYLSTSAKKTPNGDLHGYVLDLAEKEPDMFGVSIVFSVGTKYILDNAGSKVECDWHVDSKGWGFFGYFDADGRDVEYDPQKHGPLFVSCSELHAADAVDEPAANGGGLFSRWSVDTLAGQATQFLDTHPEFLDLLAAHPDVVADFHEKYLAHKRRLQGESPMADQNPAAPAAQTAPQAAPEADKTAVADAALSQPATPPETASAVAEPAATEVVDVPPADDTPKMFNADVFNRIKAKFGAEAAAHAVEVGGNYDTACEAAYDALVVRCTELEAKLAAKSTSGTPASFVPKDPDTAKPSLRDLFQSKKTK